MTIIEFSGIPGSGKSTVLPLVAQFLRAGDRDVVDQDHLIYRATKFPFNSQRFQPLIRAVPRALRSKFTKALNDYSHFNYEHQFQYMANHLSLMRYVSTAIDERPIPQSHKSMLIRWFFKMAGAYEMANEYLSHDAVFLCDEGFVHRALSLYVSVEEEAPDPAEVEHYLDQICHATVLIYVTADLDTCNRRIVARGLPKRLKGRTDREIRDYLCKSKQVTDFAVRHIVRRGGKVVVVDNANEPLVAAQIERQLSSSYLAKLIRSDRSLQGVVLEHSR